VTRGSIAPTRGQNRHQDADPAPARFVTGRAAAQPAGDRVLVQKKRKPMLNWQTVDHWIGCGSPWSESALERRHPGRIPGSLDQPILLSLRAGDSPHALVGEPARRSDLERPLPISTGRPWPPPSPAPDHGGRWAWPVPHTRRSRPMPPPTLSNIGPRLRHAPAVPAETRP